MSELRPPSNSQFPQQHGQHSQQHGQPHSTGPAKPAGMPKVSGLPPAKPAELDLDPIELVDDGPGSSAPGQADSPSKIRAFTVAGAHVTSHQFKRQPNVTGMGITRVRTFHGRLSEEGMAFMDDKINEWIDMHPEIEVKFVTTSIGVFEGKIRDQQMIMNVWY